MLTGTHALEASPLDRVRFSATLLSNKKRSDFVHPSMNHTRSGIAPETRTTVVRVLNHSLADLLDLISQLHNAHWNVRGPHFIALHKLFEELAGSIQAHVDDLAERITALGGRATGSVRETARASRIPELPATTDGMELVTELAERFALLGDVVRKDIQTTADLADPGTSDLLTGLSQALDKGLWLLEAHSPGSGQEG